MLEGDHPAGTAVESVRRADVIIGILKEPRPCLVQLPFGRILGHVGTSPLQSFVWEHQFYRLGVRAALPKRSTSRLCSGRICGFGKTISLEAHILAGHLHDPIMSEAGVQAKVFLMSVTRFARVKIRCECHGSPFPPIEDCQQHSFNIIRSLLLLGFAACAPTGNPTEEPRDHASVSQPTSEADRVLIERLRAGEEPSVLAEYTPAVLRPALDRLVITAGNGTRQVFTDEVVRGELRSVHQFAGTQDPLPVFVIVRHYLPEGRAVLMVERRTGDVFELDDHPVPSPDGMRFITASLDLVAGHSPNHVRIYHMEPSGPVPEWEFDPKEWGARHARWLDEHSIELERGVVD